MLIRFLPPYRLRQAAARGAKPARRRLGAATLALTLALLRATGVAAQDGLVDSQAGRVAAPDESNGIGILDGSVVAAPIPFSNPTIGNGLALGVGYLFKADEGSKPSVLGIGGFRSDNGSEGYGLTFNLALDNNRWLINSMLASADVRYDLYTPLVNLPLRQSGILAQTRLSYGVTPELSFGAKLRYLDTTVRLNGAGLPPIPPQYLPSLGLELLNVGVIAELDRRDDAIYPTRGAHITLDATLGTALSGGNVDYQKAYLLYDIYAPLGISGVLATRFAACGSSTSTPFFDQCSLGTTDGFRGFSATQFLDLRSISVQVEYRRQLSRRLGAVAFIGAGAVGPNYANFAIGRTHSAGGVGLRYRVSKKFPVDFSIDATTNSLNENLLYIYIGQRF
jgi:Omp85 superfamily domain